MSKSPGRPASDDVTSRIHDAFLRLLARKHFHELSVEGIALEAGVGRPSLYRRYANLYELAIAALAARSGSRILMRSSASPHDDLSDYLTAVARSLTTDNPLSRALRGLLALALTKPELRPGFARFIEGRRAPVLTRLAAALPTLTRKQIETLADRLFGPVLYRILIRQTTVSRPFIRDLFLATLPAPDRSRRK